MKKRMLILVLAVVMALGCGLLACTPDTPDGPKSETVTAYGVFHKKYAGMVTMTVDSDKKVSDVTFKEYIPLEEIGKATDSVINGVTIEADHLLNGYAKWIKVGDQIFTRELVKDGVYTYRNSTYSDGKTYDLLPTNSTDFAAGAKNAYENPDFTKFYIDNMTAGNYYVCKNATGTEMYEIPFNTYGSYGKTTTKQTWADKSVNGYWSGENFPLGWAGNMQKMEEAIEAHGMEVYTGSEEKGDNGFKLGTFDTGATLVDYHQYMAVAKKAYDAAVAKLA